MATSQNALDIFKNLKLEDIQNQIRGVEDDIRTAQNELESLRVMERAIKIRNEGKPQRAKRGEGQAAKAKAAKAAAASPARLPDPPRDEDDLADNEGHAEAEVDDCATMPITPVSQIRKGGRPVAPKTLEMRKRITTVLRSSGPMTVQQITAKLGAEYNQVINALYGREFRKLPDSRWTMNNQTT